MRLYKSIGAENNLINPRRKYISNNFFFFFFFVGAYLYFHTKTGTRFFSDLRMQIASNLTPVKIAGRSNINMPAKNEKKTIKIKFLQ